MAASIFIPGPCIVKVKAGAHVTDPVAMSGSAVSPLGVAEGEVEIIPRFNTKDINCDKLGPMVPADVIRQLYDARVRMTLVYYDRSVLDVCFEEAQAGYDFSQADNNTAGRTMGGNKALYASGNHYISLNVTGAVGGFPFRFQAAYLEGIQTIPMSVTRSKVQLDWRAIAYMTADEDIQNTVWDYSQD